MCVGELNYKTKFFLNSWTVLAAISLKSRRGSEVKERNPKVPLLAVSFAYFFSVKEIGIEIIFEFKYMFISCADKKWTKETDEGSTPRNPLLRPHFKGANGTKVIKKRTPLRKKSTAKAVYLFVVGATRFNLSQSKVLQI